MSPYCSGNVNSLMGIVRCAGWKIRFTKALRYIFWRPSVCLANVMAIHPIGIKEFHSGPKQWTDRPTNPLTSPSLKTGPINSNIFWQAGKMLEALLSRKDIIAPLTPKRQDEDDHSQIKRTCWLNVLIRKSLMYYPCISLRLINFNVQFY